MVEREFDKKRNTYTPAPREVEPFFDANFIRQIDATARLIPEEMRGELSIV